MEDGLTKPLIWQEAISGSGGLVVPIGLRVTRCSNPCYQHHKFLYMTEPGFLELLFGAVRLSTATRYHACLN